MHTSLIVVALLAAGAVPEAPATRTLKWQDSYSTARQIGRQQDKPLAVIIGEGPAGWKKVAEEGKLSQKATKLLADGYVCLYVDRTRPEGKQLAESFEVPSGSALVVSTRDGKGQAFFHAGKLNSHQLETRLAKYADAESVTRTEMLLDSRISSAYDPTPSSNPSAPAMQTYASPSFGGFGNFGGFGGSSGGSC